MRTVSMIVLLLTGAGITSGCAARSQQHRQVGVETTIPFADRHALREWEAGAANDVLYVQDYRDNWYRVRLNGPCADDLSGPYVAYTTRPTGTFDRFSRIYSTELPARTCGVTSIKTSLPPTERRPDEPDPADE
jgi:hypothetical protein